MVKRTLHFGNPVYLSLVNKSLLIVYPETGEEKKASIEDIGFVILDNNRITLTQPLLNALLENKAAQPITHWYVLLKYNSSAIHN